MRNPQAELRAQLAAHAVTLLVALAVGILVGRQFCAPQPPPPPPEALECPTPQPETIALCPPEPAPEPADDGPLEPAPTPAPRQTQSTASPLPDEPPPITATQRQQLLAWARAQSPTLQGCQRDRGRTYRVAVTLHLDDHHQTQDVTISSDQPLGTALHDCLADRIRQWTLPDDLIPHQRELLFRLSL